MFDKSLVGLDRRKERSVFRLREQRRSDAVGAPPPLATALRQLKLASFDADDAGLLKFCHHANSVAELARSLGRNDVAEPLLEMITNLASAGSGASREEMVSPFLLKAECSLN